MYRKTAMQYTSIEVNDSVLGEPLEHFVQRAQSNNEMLGGRTQLIYNERDEDIPAGHNVRTDKWIVAADGMNQVATRKRSDRVKTGPKAGKEGEHAGEKGPEGGQEGGEGVTK